MAYAPADYHLDITVNKPKHEGPAPTHAVWEPGLRAWEGAAPSG